MNLNLTGRIHFLDTFRFVAVTFALVAHITTQHGFEEYQTGLSLLSKSLTRAATPSLLMVFGIMLEIVYSRKFADNRTLVASRMLHRAALCYVAFTASALVTLVVGKRDIEGFIGAASLLTTVPYTLIFKLYLFLLIIGVGIVATRVKYGLASLLVLVGLVWGVDLLLVDGSAPWPQPFRNLGGVLFGLGSTFGPSVLHGVTLVVFGMMIGGAVFGRRSSRSATATVVLLLALAAASLFWEVRSHGLRQTLVSIADDQMYRNSNDVNYYAYGAWAAVSLMSFAYVLHRISPAPLRSLMNRLGSETLAYFLIGNCILLAMPVFQVQGVLEFSLLFPAYLLVFCGATLLWLNYARGNQSLARVEAWCQARVQALTTGMATWLARVARRSERGEPQSSRG